jgi:hypothetical protein
MSCFAESKKALLIWLTTSDRRSFEKRSLFNARPGNKCELLKVEPLCEKTNRIQNVIANLEFPILGFDKIFHNEIKARRII